MDMRMSGRNALITGGSQGIGRAIAKHFAGAGANVAIVARGQKALDEARAEVAAASNAKVITVAADVGSADGCRKAFETAQASFGQIDVLVNNAGTSQRGAFEEVSDELWQNDIDFKLFAAIGAWLGWQMLPLVLLLAAFVGAAVGLAMIAARRLGRGVPIPFGPYLAGAAWIALLWGPGIVDRYLAFAGLR